jgi:tRNA A-37 threonylcarbamoyl transferase component Bud32
VDSTTLAFTHDVNQATELESEGTNADRTTSTPILAYRTTHGPIAAYFGIVSILFLVWSAFLLVHALMYFRHFSSLAPGLVMGLIGVTLGLKALSGCSRWIWIGLSKDEITFDQRWSYSLMGRVTREWSDIHSIDFNGNATAQELAHWRALSGCSITIDFKSGGSALLELDAMKRRDVEELFLAIEAYAGQSVLSKKALLLERTLLIADESTTGEFLPLWTDALESQFAATSFVPLKTGSQLSAGRYQIRMQLASSGLSAVYLAKRYAHGKVIVKESTLPPDVNPATRAKAKELFEREARLLAKVDHPQIAKVVDHFVDEGRDYIVLEYIPGMSLRQLVQREGPQDSRKVAKWAVQIADILHYLHHLEPPIVHRDLTPDNLILGSDGTIMLIDFGVSNEFVSQATGTLVGKQAFIPPEQFRGKAEPKSDIYAFGATLFTLLTGDDPEPLTSSHPKEMLESVSSGWDQLVASCTELECENRPDSEELLNRCLKQISSALQVEAS